jgi:ubiquinone/menaquinone biosynthesis C-methylase UbiE
MIQDPERTTWRELSAGAVFTGARVLEVGCGDGRVTKMYAHAPRLTAGLEPEAGALAEAAAAVKNACFVSGSGTRLPFSSGVFDIVLFTLSLHHNPDPRTALAEAQRVLAARGDVLVLEPSPRGEIQRLCNVFNNEDRELMEAGRAVRSSGLNLAAQSSFSTRWIFKNADEVMDYAYGYYGADRDESRTRAMLDFLGGKAGDSPLEMSDTLVLSRLTA